MTPRPEHARPDDLAGLAISLWDFSWYTQAAPGEPFHDLDLAFGEAVERGYNTIRICAAPLLLFGDHDLDTASLTFVPMGGGAGERTRWYNVVGVGPINLQERFLELFRAADRAGVQVIVSSWEYQQSPAFLDSPAWHDMLSAIPPGDRYLALAQALDRLIEYVRDHGLLHTIAYVELHNEVDLSRLTEVAPPDEDTFWAQRPYLEAALAYLQERQPAVRSTVCYGIPPHLDMAAVPDNAQVAHAHVYVYGVLHALEGWAKVRADPPVFPTDELRSLLRDDAPPFEEWSHAIEPWRLEATGISPSMFYAYDWVDPVRWDAWLYRHYATHEEAMLQAMSDRLTAVMQWARRRGVPAVVGEGWIGYTPLLADFEDGPVGQHFAEAAVGRGRELGFWGLLPGSNSAPHHPGWDNVAFQRKVNAMITTR